MRFVFKCLVHSIGWKNGVSGLKHANEARRVEMKPRKRQGETVNPKWRPPRHVLIKARNKTSISAKFESNQESEHTEKKNKQTKKRSK